MARAALTALQSDLMIPNTSTDMSFGNASTQSQRLPHHRSPSVDSTTTTEVAGPSASSSPRNSHKHSHHSRSTPSSPAKNNSSPAPSSPSRTPRLSPNISTSPTAKQVLRSDGATPLFIALEETNWRQALALTDQDPESAQVWVISPGTVATTFNWSVWKRLPLHEACRRQAPLWLIHALIQAYPEALQLKNEFGQVPLHLAVEASASSEVVNLLLVSHWPAQAVVDQSGRTPLQLLQETDPLDVEERQGALQCLTRAYETWQSMKEQHEYDMEKLDHKHCKGLVAIKLQHDDDLAVEQKQADDLLTEIQKLKALLACSKGTQVELQNRINGLSTVNQTLQTTNQQQQEQISSLTTNLAMEKSKVDQQQRQLKKRSAQVSEMRDQIGDLQTALQRLQAFHKFNVKEHLAVTQGALHSVLDSFVDLHDVLTNHSDELTALLSDIGVQELQEPPCSTPRGSHEDEDKKEEELETTTNTTHKMAGPACAWDDVEEDDVVNEEAMQSAAIAASNVLQQKKSEAAATASD